MSTYKSRAQDQRVADDVVAGQDLMCGASGCPHRWSVDAGSGRLCSFHAWSEPHLWPRITQERLDALAERAHRAQQAEYLPRPKSMSKAEKMATLRALQEATTPRQHGKKDWAFRIVARSKAGDRVSPLILKMAQAVVGRATEKTKEVA